MANPPAPDSPRSSKPRPDLARRRRVARAVSGLFLLAAAALVLFSGVPMHSEALRHLFGGALIVLGLFQLAEAFVLERRQGR
jgi:hypothetical protein